MAKKHCIDFDMEKEIGIYVQPNDETFIYSVELFSVYKGIDSDVSVVITCETEEKAKALFNQLRDTKAISFLENYTNE